jgi:hypothetical protein
LAGFADSVESSTDAPSLMISNRRRRRACARSRSTAHSTASPSKFSLINPGRSISDMSAGRRSPAGR